MYTINQYRMFLQKHFLNFKEVSWTKVAVVLGALVVAWGFLQGVVPEPWHDRLFGIISFLATFISILLKASKGESPTLPTPPPGKG